VTPPLEGSPSLALKDNLRGVLVSSPYKERCVPAVLFSAIGVIFRFCYSYLQTIYGPTVHDNEFQPSFSRRFEFSCFAAIWRDTHLSPQPPPLPPETDHLEKRTTKPTKS